MRIQTWLRRTADSGTGYSLVIRNNLVKAAALIEDLQAALRKARQHHLHCDDSWYCCGKCQHPDHGLVEGEYLDTHEGEAARTSGVCNCGADTTNAAIDRVLASDEMDAHKESR